MENEQNIQLIIDGKIIDCDKSSSISIEKTVKHFKFHDRKVNDFEKLYDQIIGICPRYFNPNLPIDCDIGMDEDDFVKDKLTIRMSQNKFIIK